MSTKPFTTLVLAAGKGTRMKSPLPKVLHRACGRTLLAHVLSAASQAGASRHLVVVGTGKELVEAELTALDFPHEAVFQAEQKGTGHAALCALPHLQKTDDLVLILNGDGPLLRPETLAALVEQHRKNKAELTLGVMEPADPFGYGRVLLDKGGRPRRIVEEKEATEKERRIRVVNGGLYLVNRALLAALLPKLKPSAKTGEIYLTDIVALAVAGKKRTAASRISAEELAGVNDLSQLAEVEKVLRRRRVTAWMQAGVRVEVPEAIWMDDSVECAPGAVLGPNVVLKGKSRIGAGAVVEAGCVLKDSVVEEGAEVKAYSHLEEAVVRKGSHVGPFARLRPGADIGEEARIGNFVEVKKSVIGRGAKANHLSYIGDAEVGAGANLGCGFIACNYDGVNKHKTTVGEGAFVGSGVQAVAPVTIGRNAYVASGSTVNRDVPDGALAVGRARQENKEGYAERLKSRMLARKQGKEK
jgi:bifunctional UDP-N-acetylglucosamine pyrophosphorylase / glucosamine-1-phosphate N-acetyltransferase